MHSVTDRQTDRRHGDANSRSYCVAVRSTKTVGIVGCDVGVFVSLTMAMSTLSVITTVLVLHLHHTSYTYPVPRWIQTLAFDILARALCIRLSVGDTHPSCALSSNRCDMKTAEVVRLTSPEPDAENDTEAMLLNERTVDCLQCSQLCSHIDDILIHLRKVDLVLHLLYLSSFKTANASS